MKTAIEWLIEQVPGLHEESAIVKQAMEMEKEQIIEANENKMPFISGNEYYNETFKSE